MRLSDIHNTIPIIESVKTDFYKPVADVDKLNLYRAKQERGDVSRPSQSPHWLPDDDDDADN